MSVKIELVELMKAKGLNQTHIARAIGKSAAVISQYLNDKYQGDTASLEIDIRSFIDRQREKERSARITVKFVDTPTTRKAMDVIKMAHVEGDINVLYGEAGLGKTMICKAYTAKFRDALLIEADPGYTARVVLEELCNLLVLSTRGNMHELSESCINKLRDSGRVLIIDEAENLPLRALESIRRIHDKTGIGIVLVGMPRLLLNLKGKRGELVQLYSRVGFALNLGSSLPGADIDVIANSVLPDGVDDDLSKVLFTASKGNARRLFKLLRGAVRTSAMNDVPVNGHIVNQIAEMLIH
ncbi:AAA family ATPase [Citrobacter portucalensis]|uniref:AAA family ATPase n=1 Tax=Citrobacter portucalensis TaxID=1639133 RepID=UPI00226BB456|nr:AAA family ATPase [Citrobacter portucalensis]MCX9039354.1 AAA family ATPase [Citrobacter portucalensis]